MKETYLYICDKKPGACTGWKKDKDGIAWQKCENELCFHTSNIEHAKYKRDPMQKFEMVKQSDDSMLLFEFCGVCPHDGLKCAYKMTTAEGTGELCTVKENLPCDGLRK